MHFVLCGSCSRLKLRLHLVRKRGGDGVSERTPTQASLAALQLQRHDIKYTICSICSSSPATCLLLLHRRRSWRWCHCQWMLPRLLQCSGDSRRLAVLLAVVVAARAAAAAAIGLLEAGVKRVSIQAASVSLLNTHTQNLKRM
eukprot:TRINITY_DN243_c0_g1_i1.p1 TRINITY_DN243_c0_g1~~TRINITY_DN243_c0_g1_i1.p1  ORF type:complete len:143 (+),score=30.29 TRINITY_DN243_c0_g1_i1:698-1126(+)